MASTRIRPTLTLDAALGVENNFDALRFFAALGVVASHSYPVTQGSDAREVLMVLSNGQATIGDVCVVAFFAISGFLITQSFARSNSIIDYMTNRVLRLVPGLTAMALLTSFVVGPNVTSLSLEEYWSSLATYRFVANGLIYNTAQWLPGVFTQNIYPNIVNASLWTLSYEFSCYTAVATAGLALRRAWLAALLMATFTVASVFLTWISPRLFLEYGGYFLAGCLAYCGRSRIPLDARLFVFSLVVLISTMLLGQGFKSSLYVFGTYAILWLAMNPSLRLSGFSKNGDFSYGVYIYAFPIQQMLASVFSSPIENFLASAPIILLCAAASWHLVEKPSLTRKRWISQRIKDTLGIKSTPAMTRVD